MIIFEFLGSVLCLFVEFGLKQEGLKQNIYQIGCWMERQEEEGLKHQSLTPGMVKWMKNGIIP